MLPEKRISTHPGEILLFEFLNPMGMTQVEFARHLKIPNQRVNEIIKGKRAITPETAWLFSQSLGTTPKFWLNLQAAHDLGRTQPRQLATIADLRSRLRIDSRTGTATGKTRSAPPRSAKRSSGG